MTEVERTGGTNIFLKFLSFKTEKNRARKKKGEGFHFLITGVWKIMQEIESHHPNMFRNLKV